MAVYQILDVTFSVLPTISIVLNVFCVVIVASLTNRKLRYFSPLAYNLFVTNVLLAATTLYTKPTIIVNRGVAITVFIGEQGRSVLYCHFLTALVEIHYLCLPFIIYSSLLMHYNKSYKTWKCMFVVMAMEILIWVWEIYFLLGIYDTLSSSSFDITEKMSSVVDAVLRPNIAQPLIYIFDYTFENRVKYFVDCFLCVSVIFASLMCLLLIRYTLKHQAIEKIISRKMFFSSELRQNIFISMIAVLLLIATPRLFFDLCVLFSDRLSTMFSAPIYLGNALVPFLTPVIFIAGFYYRRISKLVSRTVSGASSDES